MRRSCQLCAQPCADLGQSEACGHVHDAALSAGPPESRRLKRRGAIERRGVIELASTPVRGGIAKNDNAGSDLSHEGGSEGSAGGEADPFAGDVDAWLGWLMDCVAIETAIRRRG